MRRRVEGENEKLFRRLCSYHGFKPKLEMAGYTPVDFCDEWYAKAMYTPDQVKAAQASWKDFTSCEENYMFRTPAALMVPRIWYFFSGFGITPEAACGEYVKKYMQAAYERLKLDGDGWQAGVNRDAGPFQVWLEGRQTEKMIAADSPEELGVKLAVLGY